MLLYINWDGFSHHWYERARSCGSGTPNLDRLVSQGASLENHFCGIPAITNPMQQTLVSGAWPEQTGNCYVAFDRAQRRLYPTLRSNRCENIVEAAIRQGRRCASVHGWYFENRGCRDGDAQAPYIHADLHNFESRVQLLLAYLRGEPVPSGAGTVTMAERPDFLSLYADDIDTVCHNGDRLPYPELRRARNLDEWYANLVWTVQRMDRALAPLMELPDLTIALAADHGGMPFGTAAFGVTAQEARASQREALVATLREAGVQPWVTDHPETPIPEDASAVLLCMGTQGMLYYLRPVDADVRQRAQRAVRDLPFIRACLDPQEQQSYGAPADFCDLYLVTRPPYHLGSQPQDEFVGGSHAGMEDSILHVFCAFWGRGIRPGTKVLRRTYLPDFAPTLCRLMGFDGPRDRTGQPLNDLLLEESL